ncbi:hypothetical protein HZH68_013312 [Vespula germanica]|uniref:Uncharacterized protein n=1 Tax=Vespula germanica TaxID=30212 RepID=A0A834MVN5_VESGE|nr:hypothetical protein HZH68_013312 [Vespula germanica]
MYSHKLSNDTRNSATISRVSSVLITTMPTEVSSLVLFRHAEAKYTDFSPKSVHHSRGSQVTATSTFLSFNDLRISFHQFRLKSWRNILEPSQNFLNSKIRRILPLDSIVTQNVLMMMGIEELIGETETIYCSVSDPTLKQQPPRGETWVGITCDISKSNVTQVLPGEWLHYISGLFGFGHEGTVRTTYSEARYTSKVSSSSSPSPFPRLC